MKRAHKTALSIAAVATLIFVISVILALLGLAMPPLVVVGGVGIVGAGVTLLGWCGLSLAVLTFKPASSERKRIR